ncbi:MAG: penicillin-binding protein activator LpoB [Nitrospirae bacterium]|nr:MAG: penicillin-binding protein activator LpoB [Nitrospirota bacterium]
MRHPRIIRWLCVLWSLAVGGWSLAILGGCGPERRVTRVDTDVVTDLSGRWNDTDSRLVAEKMIREMLTRPWLEQFRQRHHRSPVVIVGTIRNRSHEHINVETFIADLERELTNSQLVTFVANPAEREAIRQERRDQAIHAREETQSAPGRELGADFQMQGQISTILDESDGVKAIFYQVDLELISLKDNVKSWYGQHKIKKVIERRRLLF